MKRFFALLIVLIALSSCGKQISNQTSIPPTSTPITKNTPQPTEQPTIVKVAEFGKGVIFDHALSPDETTMAIASSSGLYFYSMSRKEMSDHISAEWPEDIEKVAYSPDGSLLAYQGRTIRVLDVLNKNIVFETYPTVFKDSVEAIAISNDNHYFAFITQEINDFGGICADRVEIWDIELREQLVNLLPPEDNHDRNNLPCSGWETLALNTSDGLLYAGFGGGLVAWETTNWNQVFYTPIFSGDITDLFLDLESNLVVSVDDAGNVRYWDAVNGQMLRHIAVPIDGKVSLQLTPDRKKLIVQAKGYPNIAIDYITGKLIGESDENLAVDGFSTLAETLYEDGFYSLHEIASFVGAYVERNIAFSGDGKSLLTGCTIVDTESGALISILSSCENTSNWQLAYSSKGNYIAEGTSRLEHSLGTSFFVGIFRLWDAHTGSLLFQNEYEDGVYSLAFSSDENVLATGTDSVSLWNTKDHTLIKVLHPETGRVEYIGFRDSDQTLIAITVPHYVINIFDIKSGELINSIQPPLSFLNYEYRTFSFQENFLAIKGMTWVIENNNAVIASRQLFSVTGVHVFSPDGKVMILGKEQELGYGKLQKMVLVDTKTGEVLYTFSEDFQDLHPVFSPDGKRIAVITFGGTIQIWDVSQFTALASQ